ncbi:MAG: helix-turn-helix transcriptional regulator [Chitinophagales bacterium]|nr:helix-turn-helix transcriptional regulator [Chitinophagales bacterium]
MPSFNANIAPLTGRESEILAEFSNGLTSKQVSGKLGIKFDTVETYRKSILRKLGATNTTMAVANALRWRMMI